MRAGRGKDEDGLAFEERAEGDGRVAVLLDQLRNIHAGSQGCTKSPPPRPSSVESGIPRAREGAARMRAGVTASALQAARLVLEAVDPLRSLARIQRLLDIAIAVVRLRALERFRQPLDKALDKIACVAHLLLRRRMEGPATPE